MHNYQKLNFALLAIMLGASASASAKSFPQDYLSTGQGHQTAHSVVTESQKDMSLSMKPISSPYHIHELRGYVGNSETVEVKAKMVEMTDAKSTSTLHLFEQYL